MYNYKLNVEAEEDLARIFEYGISRFGIIQAIKYYDLIFDCFSRIAFNPFLFPEAFRFREGYRYCVCGVDTIFYRINNNEVEIMAIIWRQNY